MPAAAPCFFFDFVDPLSYLVDLSIGEIEASGRVRVERIGCELRPSPAPLTRPSHPLWTGRWDTARRASPTLSLDSPPIVPWTRKAHELHAFGRSHQAGDAVRRGIFDAYFRRCRDIGRVDELVEIAVAAGLDRTAAKAALDVDAHVDDVLEARGRAEEAGLGEVPALLVDGTLVQGFHNLGDLSTLLGGPPQGGR